MKSKLTIEQQKLVRTPAFKKWFGDWEHSPETSSKVVDENGEPKVVYHATKGYVRKFNEFKPTQSYRYFYGKKIKVLSPSFFFTDDKNKVKSFGRTIIPVFLKIIDPLDYKYIQSDVDTHLDYIIGNLKARYPNNDLLKGDDTPRWVYYDYNEYVDRIQSLGFDGVFDEERDRFIVRNTFIVFNSRQIKLADGTNTAFDSNSDDIRFGGGGSIESKGVFKKLGTSKQLGIAPKIAGHDMIAKCDCGEKFSYQNSKKDILWQCPECNGMKKIDATKMTDGGKIMFKIKSKKAVNEYGWKPEYYVVGENVIGNNGRTDNYVIIPHDRVEEWEKTRLNKKLGFNKYEEIVSKSEFDKS